MSAFFPISGLTSESRVPAHPVAFGPDAAVSLAWADLWRRVDAVEAYLRADHRQQWILYTESTPEFLLGFLALLRAGKEIVLPANKQPGTIAAAGGREAGNLDEGALSRIVAGGSPAQALGRVDVDPDCVFLSFFTSGSTGTPKAITKRLTQIESELANLHALWGRELQGRTVRSSVSHQHIYGFLFSAMLPLCMGLPISEVRVESPDTLERLQGEATSLVLSPAFLKRAVQARAAPYPFDIPPVIFSSGGVLPAATADATERLFSSRAKEIYGSTETGGIAYRTREEQPWTCFPGISVRIDGDSRIEVKSPYLFASGFFSTGDAGELLSPGTFLLRGRMDSIVKIEEKRVSLDEMESRIRESPFVEDAHVIALETSRQFLAAGIVLSPAGKSRFASASRGDITAFFRTWLLTWFERIVLPRKWRYVESIPRDNQGKVLREVFLALFGPQDRPGPSIEPEVSHVQTDGTRLSIFLRFPADSPYFEGHFPSFHLLPGVTQVDWVMRFACRHFGITGDLEEIMRLKFSSPILPGTPLRIELELDAEKDQIQFRYLDRESGAVYSWGKLKLRRPA